MPYSTIIFDFDGTLADTLEESRRIYNLLAAGYGLREHFDFISSTSKLTGKSTHLRAIRKTFSLDLGDMLYVGDEIRDIKAAKKAGVAMAAVTWGFNSAESLQAESPEHLLSAPHELLHLVPPI